MTIVMVPFLFYWITCRQFREKLDSLGVIQILVT
jgi:hypothetical protein